MIARSAQRWKRHYPAEGNLVLNCYPRRLTAALLCFFLLATGCAANMAPDVAPAETSAATTSTDSTSTVTSPGSQTRENDVGDATRPAPSNENATTDQPADDEADNPVAPANALDLTGHVQAATVPDMEPVVTDAKPSLPATVTDITGNKITVTSANAVLALDLYGTLTDTMIGLGLANRLIGRSNSDTQAVLADLPLVTKDGHDLNVEAVLNLQPDLILTNTTIGADRLYEQIEAAGVTVVRFEQVPALDGIAATIHQIGAVFGMQDAADQLAADTAQRLEQVRERIDQLRSETPHAPRGIVLYIRGTAGVFFILGSEYGAADILATLGLEDVAQENGIDNLKPANAEAFVQLDPEIILAMNDGVESTGGITGLLERPGVAATTAGMNQRVITAADSQLLAYGPRTPENLLALAEAIYLDQTSSSQ